jgi:RNA polymerase sigma-70 factor (ECF subfamily)
VADPAEREASERAIRALCEAGDHAGATTAALRSYGVELLGFLRALAGEHDLAAEAFAELGEDIWKGLPRFRWESSLRSWLYALARNALAQLRRDPRRRRELDLVELAVSHRQRMAREALRPRDRQGRRGIQAAR